LAKEMFNYIVTWIIDSILHIKKLYFDEFI